MWGWGGVRDSQWLHGRLLHQPRYTCLPGSPLPAVAFSSFTKANAPWWEEEGVGDGREGARREISTPAYPAGTPWHRETPAP